MNISELKILWKKVFEDEEAYIDRFFSQIYKQGQTLIHQEEGHAVAMLHMIPYNLRIDGRKFRAMYLYALATEEKYRGKGIMSGLIHQAHRIADERGYLCSFLIPERESLYGFYQKFGYTVPFYDNEVTLCPDLFSQGTNLHKVNMSNDELWGIQQSFYDRNNRIIMPDRNQFEFFLEDFFGEGGKVYCITGAGIESGYVYGTRKLSGPYCEPVHDINGCKNGKITVCHTNMEENILTGGTINAVITYRIRGLFRPARVCKQSGIDINGIYVKNVLC